MATTSTTLAVLIDADNAQPAVIDGLLAEIAKYGTATVKRIYGDWTARNSKAGRKCCSRMRSSRSSNSATRPARTRPIPP